MKKNIKLIPLFLFLFVFQLLYFLSTIYTEKIDHIFLILAVFMILICILLYCVLSDVLKKSNAEMELAFLQKQKQLKQEQDYSLQIRRQDTRDFQTKTVQELQDFQLLLEPVSYTHLMGCYEVTLNVWAGNTSAEKFYEKMGMKTKERQMEYILEH